MAWFGPWMSNNNTQAVDYMLDNLPKTRAMCEQEVDRYCVVPGQACSYKVQR